MLGSLSPDPEPLPQDEATLPLLARQNTITGTVYRIDGKAHRLTVRTDGGRTVSLPVEEPAILNRLHEGERIDVELFTDHGHRAVRVIATPGHRTRMTI